MSKINEARPAQRALTEARPAMRGEFLESLTRAASIIEINDADRRRFKAVTGNPDFRGRTLDTLRGVLAILEGDKTVEMPKDYDAKLVAAISDILGGAGSDTYKLQSLLRLFHETVQKQVNGAKDSADLAGKVLKKPIRG